MIKDWNVPNDGLRDLPIYANIERSVIMKVSVRPELFSCSELISWILPKEDITKMILSNVVGQGFAAYISACVAQSCKLPTTQIYLTKKWLKEIYLDIFYCFRKIMVQGKQFRTRPTGEYETANLGTPYSILALMLNRIFDRANGKFYKISWVPVIYVVSTQGTIFN